jgi:hypothetical protein
MQSKNVLYVTFGCAVVRGLLPEARTRRLDDLKLLLKLKEVDMFARNVSFHLKSNMLSDYTGTFENEILPLLRKQKGFTDEITLSNPGSLDASAISLWETKPTQKLTTPIAAGLELGNGHGALLLVTTTV